MTLAIEILHPAFGVGERLPAILRVETMRIACRQQPAAQSLQVGMSVNGFHQPFAQAPAAVILMDEDITKVSKDGIIADDARQTDLPLAIVKSKDKRVGKRALETLTRTPA